MASLLQRGQILHGRETYYKVINRLGPGQSNLWLARTRDQKPVLIKPATFPHFDNEVETLELCRGQKSIRALLDVTDSPQSMVLEYLDTNLYEALHKRQLERQDVKRAAKAALEGLTVLHDNRRVHTNIIPENLLASYGSGESRLGDIKLDVPNGSILQDVSTNNGRHIISAPLYRAPEVILNVPWTTAVDIWSLGATLIYYLLRRHIFVSHGLKSHDLQPQYMVLLQQNVYFGPFPRKFSELIDNERAKLLKRVSREYNIGTGIFSKKSPKKINPEDRDFICYLMRPDPRDRPSSKEALTHPWFKDVDAC